MNFSGPTT